MKKVSQLTTKKLAIAAIMIALEVVLSRFLSINLPSIKIGFAFIPIMLLGYLFGPIYSTAAAVVADLIGALLFPSGAFFPGFTFSAALVGLVYGLCLYKKCTVPRIIIAVVVRRVAVGQLLDTLWISMLYGTPYKELFITRLVQTAVMIVVEFIVAYLLIYKANLAEKLKLKS